MNTESRLKDYYHFDEQILQSVGTTALQQNKLSFQELADDFGIGAGPQLQRPTAQTNRTIEFFQINPSADYDESKLRICQSPMGIPADKSMAMRAIRLFGSDPTVPLIVVGSPASIGNRANRLKLADLNQVRRGDLEPAISPMLQFIMNQGVTKLEVVGYSYGADAGAAILSASNRYDIKTECAVLIEPAGVQEQSVLNLAKSFGASGAELEAYVDQTESAPLFEARNRNQSAIAGLTGFSKWAGGFLRASNLAIAQGLSRGRFAPTLDRALDKQAELKVAIAWGSASELVNADAITEAIRDLSVKHPHRVLPMEMNGMHHGGGDDIDLHAAMVLQGLALTANH